ncbi:tol-pal system-associated acyl-CoA thioesterase [Cellvibrio sp. pealriver]|uniref:tol-pal system-associated acyl-CoA thioesterase n=1 Tax=Cellvibrio sp. pealriver TaxID=1622269 RepID=UPI00066FD82C|nr:tol-pal system-associated acyl-CoA thioesterase [Cellvibrio sp. pealriver]
MNAFSTPVRVYIEDTDAGGIVYYVNYLKFMERGRTEFLRSFGYDKPAILDGGLLLVVHSAQINYRRPARLDDLLNVTAQIHKLARTYIEFQQRVLRGEELMCEGVIRIACVDAESMKPNALPASMYQQLNQLCRL